MQRPAIHQDQPSILDSTWKKPRCSHLNQWFGWGGEIKNKHTASNQQLFHSTDCVQVGWEALLLPTVIFFHACHHTNKEHCFWLGRRISRDQGSAWASHWQFYPRYKPFKMPVVILLPLLPFVVSTTWLVNCFKKSKLKAETEPMRHLHCVANSLLGNTHWNKDEKQTCWHIAFLSSLKAHHSSGSSPELQRLGVSLLLQ